MPKSLTSPELIKLLLKNGFVEQRQSGSHKVFYNKESKRRVIVPFHRRDLPKGTLNEILKQAGLK